MGGLTGGRGELAEEGSCSAVQIVRDTADTRRCFGKWNVHDLGATHGCHHVCLSFDRHVGGRHAQAGRKNAIGCHGCSAPLDVAENGYTLVRVPGYQVTQDPDAVRALIETEIDKCLE